MLIGRNCQPLVLFVMLEESVSSSPCKSKKSMRQLRCMRRSKRKGQAVTNQGIQAENMFNRILQCLYNDSDDDSPEEDDPSDTTIGLDPAVRVFNPFRRQKVSCFATLRSAPSRLGSANVPISKPSGFLPCQSTLESERNIEVPIVDNCNHEITDAELLNCWLEVDKMLTSTPKKELNLVDSILKDFSLSPYTEKPNENAQFWEYSPEFVLKSKPRITYSSRKRNTLSVECNKRLDFSLNDECHTDSSCLSVQENLSQLDEVSATTNVADTTERFCENLLNLSAHYTQTCPTLHKQTPDALSCLQFKEDSETMDLLPTFSNVVSLVQEITSLRETGSHSLRKSSSYTWSQDTFGFLDANSYLDDENETTLRDNRCGTPVATVFSPIYSPELDEDRKTDMDVEGEEFDEWSEDCTEMFAFIKTPPNNCKKEVGNSVDVVVQSRDKVCFGFKTASSKQIHISSEAEKKAADMLKNLPEIIPKQSVKCNILNATSVQVRKPIGIDNSEIINRTFKCSGINALHDQPTTSKAALRANCGSIAQQPNKVKTIGTPSKHSHYHLKGKNGEEEINQKNFLTSTQGSNANAGIPFFNCNEPVEKQLERSDTNIGFQTANGKNLKPTSKALKNVKMLLKDFQSEQGDENCLVSMKNEINLKQCKQTTSDTKVINDKENSVLWAEEELANVIFSEWPLEDLIKSQSSQTKMPEGTETKTSKVVDCPSKPMLLESSTSLTTEFGGFQTAGGKKVAISEKGKQIAEGLLQKITNDSDTKDLLDIKNSIQKKYNKTVLATKPITPQNDPCLGLKTISTYEETADSCTITENKHSHVSKTLQNKPTNSFTELSVKAPLDVSVTNSIIARRNLLSLKRRRKGSLISPARGANANALAGIIKETPSEHADTPNKMQSSSNTAVNGVQTPSTLNAVNGVQTPSTLNARELYFNDSKCSTPCSKQEINNNLKPISSNNNKSISDTCSNIKFDSPSPSVNDRIARLRMYGEAPPISPILANLQNNCRIRGLKRPRSMLKKAENK